eukprot:GHVS01032526.1.p1 GENE.GHVS01032526.1~~GHVS01032526.1.p1  ORF type:complete len:889 (-),score=177.75 GHVS01032526.1:700-3366(-)
MDPSMKAIWDTFGGVNPLYESLRRNAEQHPSEAALVWINNKCEPDRELTYEDLFVNCRRLAMHLRHVENVKSGDRVILVYPPADGLDFVVAFYACLFIGATAVPVYPVEPAKYKTQVERFADIVTTAGTRIALTNPEYSRAARALSLLTGNKVWKSMRWISSPDVLAAATRPSTLSLYVQSDPPPPPSSSSSDEDVKVEEQRSAVSSVLLSSSRDSRITVDVSPKSAGTPITSVTTTTTVGHHSGGSIISECSTSESQADTSGLVSPPSCPTPSPPMLPGVGSRSSLIPYPQRNLSFPSTNNEVLATSTTHPSSSFAAAAGGVYYEGSTRLVFRPQHLQAKSIAFLQFTSGSTDAPKGVMVTHAGLLHNCHLVCRSCNFTSQYETPTTTPTNQEEQEEDGTSGGSKSEEISAQSFELWEYRDVFWPRRHAISMERLNHRVRAFSWLPIYHDMGLIGCTVAPLTFGLTVYQMSPIEFVRRPYLWLLGMSRYGCFTSGAPNFGFELVTRKMPDEVYDQLDLSRVSSLLCGAEPIRQQTMEAFMKLFGPRGLRRCAFLPAYGLAENTLIVSGRANFDDEPTVIAVNANKAATQGILEVIPNPEESAEPVKYIMGCGKPCPGVEVRIVNADTKVPCASGEFGEIWIRGSSTAVGYFQEKFKTEMTFGHSYEGQSALDSRGYLRSGDSGIVWGGELFVSSRIKDTLIIRGRNYFPQDIESVVATCCGVRAGCTAAFPLDGGEQEVLGLGVEVKDWVVAGRREECQEPLPSTTKAINWIKDTCWRLASSQKGRYPACPSLAERIAAAVHHSTGLRVHRLWLLKPRTIPKTTSGKIRRSFTRERLLADALVGVIDCFHLPQPAGSLVSANCSEQQQQRQLQETNVDENESSEVSQ